MKNDTIIFLCEFYYPHWTGIAQVATTLAQEYALKGKNVTVVTTRLDTTQSNYAVENKVHVYREPYIFKISRTNYSITTLYRFLLLVQQQDIIFIHSPHSNILFLSLIAKLFRKKLYIYQHGDLILPSQTGNRLTNFGIQKLYDIVTFLSYLCADTIMTQTKDYAKHSRLMKYFLYKFQPYIFSIRPFTKKSNSIIVKKLRLLKKQHLLVGFAGRFVEEKGFDILLDAIPIISAKNSKIFFIFAGAMKIPYERFYEKNIQKINAVKSKIINLGLLDDSGLKAFYENIDCFVIPSRSDCFPYTQIEAMKFGVPLVTTNIPGARMLIKETGFGILVKPNNPQKLADGIISLLKKKDTIRKKKNNLSKFIKKYGHIKDLY